MFRSDADATAVLPSRPASDSVPASPFGVTSTTQMRIRVENLPRFTTTKTLKKFLEKLGLSASRVNKAPNWTYALVTFKTPEDQTLALEQLNGAQMKKNVLSARVDHVSEQTLQEVYERRAASKRVDLMDDTRPPSEILSDQVTPLHKVAYDEQLRTKQANIIRVLGKFRDSMKGLDNMPKDVSWVHDAKPDNLPCELLDIVASPITHGYRSKCEFTIGRNLAGERTVGFLLGRFRAGLNVVEEPTGCIHVSETAKKIAAAMQDYVRNSRYDAYNAKSKEGHWRLLVVRTQRSGEVMIVVQIQQQALDPDEIAKEKTFLREYFVKKASEKEFTVTSLLLQVHNGVSEGISDTEPLECLLGGGFVHEELLECRFRISPRAFFQSNIACTELMYKQCQEWAQLQHAGIPESINIRESALDASTAVGHYGGPSSSIPVSSISPGSKVTLLDLCCGTGTIGITMARHVHHVVGIEMIAEAVEDARVNATLNDVNNVEFYAGKVENHLNIVQRAATTTGDTNDVDVVAILDPPRAGVHQNVIKAVRACTMLKRVIFIACDPEAAITNFISLCRPTSNNWTGTPFHPTKAVAFDMFPHTRHCELLVIFERN